MSRGAKASRVYRRRKDCCRNTRDRHRETQCREDYPEVTVGPEEEEPCVRRHESGHPEYGEFLTYPQWRFAWWH
jgi:hypothetical protein